MFKRLAAVLLVYSTRRILWLLAAVYLAILGIGWLASSPAIRNSPIPAVPDGPPLRSKIDRRDDLKRLVAEGREAEVESLDCQRDWGDFGSALNAQMLNAEQQEAVLAQLHRDRPLPKFDQFPNLRALDLTDCVLFPEDAERLTRCAALEWLSFDRTVVVDRDFNFLPKMQRLDTLILGTLQSAPEQPMKIDSDRLPDVRMLALKYSPADTKQALRLLKNATRLQDLAIHQHLDAESVDLLRAVPAMRRLFVAGYKDDPSGFRDLRGALPQVRIWHTELEFGLCLATVFLGIATFFLGFGLLSQIQATFSLPTSRLTPRYQMPHWIVPLGIGAAGMFLQTVIASSMSADFSAALSLQVLALGTVSATAVMGSAMPYVVLPERRRRVGDDAEGGGSPRKINMAGIFVIPVVFLFVGAVAIVTLRPYLLESFLLGEMTRVTAGFFLLGTLGMVAAVIYAPRLAVILNESGLSPVLTIRDAQRRQLQFAPGTTSAWKRRLARLLTATRPVSWFWQVRAIDCGNPSTFLAAQVRSAWIALLIGTMQGVMMRFMDSQAPGIQVAAGFSLGFLMLISCGMAFQMRWFRRKAMSRELLYPWTRRQMTLAVFGSCARDAAQSLLIPLLVVPVLNYSLNWRIPMEGLLAGACALVGAVALGTAVTLCLLTVQNGILTCTLGIGGLYGLIFAVVGSSMLLVGGDDLRREQIPEVLLVAAAECLLGALLFTWFAFRRWMQREWGLIEA